MEINSIISSSESENDYFDFEDFLVKIDNFYKQIDYGTCCANFETGATQGGRPCSSYVYGGGEPPGFHLGPLDVPLPGAEPTNYPGGFPPNKIYVWKLVDTDWYPYNSDGRLIGPPVPNVGFKASFLDCAISRPFFGPRPTRCFPKGTLVLSKNGYISIEKIKIGDQVYSYNTKDKKVEDDYVKDVFASEVNKCIELDFGTEKIRCTPPHKFYTGDWIAAESLNIGDKILTYDSTWVELLGKVEFIETINVFNIHVSNYQNYFVGENKFLVHNKGEDLGYESDMEMDDMEVVFGEDIDFDDYDGDDGSVGGISTTGGKGGSNTPSSGNGGWVFNPGNTNAPPYHNILTGENSWTEPPGFKGNGAGPPSK